MLPYVVPHTIPLCRQLTAPNLRTSRRAAAGGRSHSQEHYNRQKAVARGGQGYPRILGQRSASTHPLSPGCVMPGDHHAGHVPSTRYDRYWQHSIPENIILKRKKQYSQHRSAGPSVTTRWPHNLWLPAKNCSNTQVTGQEWLASRFLVFDRTCHVWSCCHLPLSGPPPGLTTRRRSTYRPRWCWSMPDTQTTGQTETQVRGAVVIIRDRWRSVCCSAVWWGHGPAAA